MGFVCRGNTCRSPLCESLFNEILDANPVLKETFAYAKSAGVATYTDKVSNGAMKIGASHGLAKRMKEHLCTQVSASTFDNYDFILCMDDLNRDYLEEYAGVKAYENMKKVNFLRSFDPNSDETQIDDPIGSDLSTYESTYQQVLSCISQYILDNVRTSPLYQPVDFSKFTRSGFSASKSSVIFVCKDNRFVSPVLEAIFNKKIRNSSNLSEKFNISSSTSISQQEWGI